jgi:hypothetical protein
MLALVAMTIALGGCDASFSVGGNGSNGSAGGNEAAPAQPATRHFANARTNAASEELRTNFVDFSFDYPGGWQVTPQPTDGSARNFVRVAAPEVHGYTPYAFHVGWAAGSGNAAEDEATFTRLLPEFARDFGQSMQDYRIVSTGRDRIGRYESYGWRFTAAGPAARGEPGAQIYGRGDIVMPPGQRQGVMIVTMATDRSPDVRRADDVGSSAAIRAIFESFRLGADAGGGEAEGGNSAR